MVTPIILLLAIKCKCSIFNNFRDTAHSKRSTFAKHLTILKFLYLQEYQRQNIRQLNI